MENLSLFIPSKTIPVFCEIIPPIPSEFTNFCFGSSTVPEIPAKNGYIGYYYPVEGGF
jgi:hypothetical protein